MRVQGEISFRIIVLNTLAFSEVNVSEMPSRQIIKTSLGIVRGRPLRATNLATEIQYLYSQHFHSGAQGW